MTTTQPDLFTPADADEATADDGGVQAEDPDGLDGPIHGDSSLYQADGSLPDTYACVHVFDLEDFNLSPFNHPETVPKQCMELWAKVFGRATQALIDALEDTTSNRDCRIGAAAGMYLGLPQLIFRDTDGGSYRWLVQTKARLNAFL